MLFRNPRRPSLLAPQHSADSFCCTLILLAAEVSGVRNITITAARMRRYHFAGGSWPSTAWPRRSGRNGSVRLALDGIPQPPLLFCDILPDYSVILGLSPNCSFFSVAQFYAFVISHGKYPIYSHIPMSRHLWAGSSTFFGRLFDLPCSSFGPAYAFVILWHTVQ